VPALDLDEHHDVAVATHEIDLAVAEPDVTLQDAKAGTREVRRRAFFRRTAQRLARIGSHAHTVGIAWAGAERNV
jgi:hypothetical protein